MVAIYFFIAFFLYCIVSFYSMGFLEGFLNCTCVFLICILAIKLGME
jgi:hypothetical protein